MNVLDDDRDDRRREQPEDGLSPEQPRGERWQPGGEHDSEEMGEAPGMAEAAEDDGPDAAALPDELPAPDGELPEPPGDRRPPRAATYVASLVVVMAIIGIVTTITTVLLYREQRGMGQALMQSIDRLEAAYAGPEASDTSKRRLAWLQRAVDEGDWSEVQKALQALGTPETVSPPGEDLPMPGESDREQDAEGGGQPQLPSPDRAQDLSAAAKDFFKAHQELWRGFFGFSVAIRRAEQQGAEVADLEKLRDEMVGAAEAGDAEKVESLLRQAAQGMGDNGQQRVPDTLKQKLETFGGAFKRAQQQRRDVRAAVRLAQQSEQAARRGRYERAEQLIDQALGALQRAPRMGAGARAARPTQRPGGPRVAPELGFLRFVANLMNQVMETEMRNLAQIQESVTNAAVAVREKNAEQVRSILSEAKDALEAILGRRRQMATAISKAQEQVRSGQQGRQRPEGPLQQQREEQMEAIAARVTGILKRVREMPEDEFQANQAEIARQVLAAITSPVEPSERGGPPLEDMTPEQRVRTKMRIAGEMYARLRDETDVDTAELEEMFEEARELIVKHEYEQAEEVVDRSVGRMRVVAQDALDERPGPESSDRPRELPAPPREDAPQIDLRGLGGDEPIIAPPPAASEDTTPDTANQTEETEQ